MTDPNKYAWMAGLVAAHFQAEQAQPKKPRLTLITADPMPLKGKKRKMPTTSDREAMKAEIANIIKEAIPPAAPSHSTPLYRKLSGLKLVDHVSMVHNALEAVRCLAIPSSGNGISPSGYQEDLSAIGRNHFVDLLKIINDRLGAALEMEDAQT